MPALQEPTIASRNRRMSPGTETRNRPYEIRENIWREWRGLSTKAPRHQWKTVAERDDTCLTEVEFRAFEHLTDEVIDAWESEHASDQDNDL